MSRKQILEEVMNASLSFGQRAKPSPTLVTSTVPLGGTRSVTSTAVDLTEMAETVSASPAVTQKMGLDFTINDRTLADLPPLSTKVPSEATELDFTVKDVIPSSAAPAAQVQTQVSVRQGSGFTDPGIGAAKPRTGQQGNFGQNRQAQSGPNPFSGDANFAPVSFAPQAPIKATSPATQVQTTSPVTQTQTNVVDDMTKTVSIPKEDTVTMAMPEVTRVSSSPPPTKPAGAASGDVEDIMKPGEVISGSAAVNLGAMAFGGVAGMVSEGELSVSGFARGAMFGLGGAVAGRAAMGSLHGGTLGRGVQGVGTQLASNAGEGMIGGGARTAGEFLESSVAGLDMGRSAITTKQKVAAFSGAGLASFSMGRDRDHSRGINKTRGTRF